MQKLHVMGILIACLFVLNMCAETAPIEVTRTVISFAAPREEKLIYNSIINKYNSVNPATEVRFRELEDVLTENSNAPLQSNSALDTVVRTVDTAVVPFIGEANVTDNLLYDLSSLIDADTSFRQSDYYTGTLKIWSQAGAVYGLPREVSVPLLTYNKDVWSTFGLPMPSNNWTWRDLAQAAQQLAQSSDANSEAPMYGFTDSVDGQLVLVGSLYETNPEQLTTSPDQLQLKSPEFVSALNWIDSLIQTRALYTVAKSAASERAGDINTRIQDQRIGIWRNDTLPIDSTAGMSFATGTISMPPLPKPLSGAGTSAYVMSRGTQHAQEAWQWLSFLSKQTSVSPASANLLPARRSINEQSNSWKNVDGETRNAILATLNRSVQTIDSAPVYQDVLASLTAALQSTLTGKSADDALLEAQSELDTARASRASAPTASAASPLFVVATPQSDIVPEGATAVRFGSFADDLTVVRSMVKVFQQSNPDIFVQLKDGSNSSEPLSFAGLAETTDCFTWHGQPPAGELTATLDLQPLLDADATIPRDDYPPALLSPFKRGDELHGLPYIISLKTIGYNPRLFSSAGIKMPSIQWTPDDLLAAAEALTQHSGDVKQYGYAETPVQIPNLKFFLSSFGASMTHNVGANSMPNFTDPKVIKAVAYYVRLLRSTSPAPRLQGYRGETETENGKIFPDLLKEGRVGMWLNLGSYSILDQVNSNNIAVAPLPLGAGTINSDIVGIESSFYISAYNAQPQACWEWFKELSSNIGVIPLPGVEGQNYFPARRSIAESAAFGSQAAPGALDVYRTYMEALAQAPVALQSGNDFDDLINWWFYRAVDRVLQGKDAERELAEAQQIAEDYRACTLAGGENGACAQQADPTFGK